MRKYCRISIFFNLNLL